MKIAWLAVDKAIAKIARLTFLAHPVEIFIKCRVQSPNFPKF